MNKSRLIKMLIASELSCRKEELRPAHLPNSNQEDNIFFNFNESSEELFDLVNHSEDKLDLTIWQSIVKEHEKDSEEIQKYINKINPAEDCLIPKGSTVEYMEQKVFSILLPILVDLLVKAEENKALDGACNTFDGLDLISEYLWNNNPNYPERKEENLGIHDMPWVKEWLTNNPRPYYPKSWIYTEEIAAKTIQSYLRGYWVRRSEEVQELRTFWKLLKADKEGKYIRETINWTENTTNNTY